MTNTKIKTMNKIINNNKTKIEIKIKTGNIKTKTNITLK